MKLIIAGSRDILIPVSELDTLIQNNFSPEDINNIDEVVSGNAVGMDTVGIMWAAKHKIPVKKFIPDWTKGRSAGHIRNREMGDYADQAIVVYNGSNGSQGMIDYMCKLKKPCVVIRRD
jgi:hypothetical protein